MTSGMRKFIFFVLLVGLAYIMYSQMIKPANQHMAQQRVKVQEKLAKLAELEKATAAVEDLNKELEELEDAISFFESKLPPSSDVYVILEDVTLIAQKHGLRPKTIRTLAQKNNSGYIEQPLKMELEGDFNSYYSFLLELERLDRITKIREIEFKKKAGSEGLTNVSFVVSIFFQDSLGSNV